MKSCGPVDVFSLVCGVVVEVQERCRFRSAEPRSELDDISAVEVAKRQVRGIGVEDGPRTTFAVVDSKFAAEAAGSGVEAQFFETVRV